jgi:muramoyltetrapeptide carboxypeptidase
MKRKHFLRQMMAVSAGLGLAQKALAHPDPTPTAMVAQPPFLVPGDTIGITCPASPVELKDMVAARQTLTNWGFNVCVGNTVGRHWERFGGSDAERAGDLQLMLNDPSVKAILFARGGYGAMRMMDKVDWSALKKNPKWLVGYSDITAIHCHVLSTLGMPTIHGDMVNGFKIQPDISTISLQKVLTGQRIEYRAPWFDQNRAGQATGMLVGGNISLITAMQGSASDLNTDGKILFLEEVSEYKYTLDRMLMSMKRSGKFNHLAGLIIGGITATKNDSETYFPMSVEEIIKEKVSEFNYPVCFQFPAGHIRENMALKLGVHYNLYTSTGGTILSEVSDPHPVLPLSNAISSDSLQLKNELK